MGRDCQHTPAVTLSHRGAPNEQVRGHGDLNDHLSSMEEWTRGLPIGGKGKLHIHEIPQFWDPLDQCLLLVGRGQRALVCEDGNRITLYQPSITAPVKV